MTQITNTTAAALANHLATRTPAEVERALQSRASSRRVGFAKDADRAVAIGEVAHGPPDALRTTLHEAEQALTPAAPCQIEEWLAELDAITMAARKDEFTANLALEALTRRIQAYPADVARDVVLGWDCKFFPTWAELKERLDAKVAPRRQMVAALRRGLDVASRQQPCQRGPRCSPEAARRIVAEAGFACRLQAGAARS